MPFLCYKRTKGVIKMDTDEIKKFLENANVDNLIKAKEEVGKELATAEQQRAVSIYLDLIDDKETCERAIKEYETYLKEVNEKLKFFEVKAKGKK